MLRVLLGVGFVWMSLACGGLGGDFALCGHGVEVPIEEAVIMTYDADGVVRVEPVFDEMRRIDATNLSADLPRSAACSDTTWRIVEPGVASVEWFRGMGVASGIPGSGLAFQLYPHEDGAPAMDESDPLSIMFMRGDLDGPFPDAMLADYQEMVAQDDAAGWVEVRYDFDGEAWRQLKIYRVVGAGDVFLFTAQAPEGQHEAWFERARRVEETVRLE